MKILEFEVPMHYMFIFSSDTLHEAVELGVQQARKWCDANGIPLTDPAPRHRIDLDEVHRDDARLRRRRVRRIR